MNNRFLALAAATFLVASASLLAQHTEVKVTRGGLPPEPLVANVPEKARWTVFYHYSWELDAAKLRKLQGDQPSSGSREPAPLPRKVQAAFMKGTLLEQTQATDGSSTERLIAHGWVAEQARPGEAPAVERLAVLYPDTPFRPGRFNEFAWVSPAAFAGEAVYGGSPCFVYREMRAPPAEGEGAILRSAYIHRQTRLPVAIEDFLGIRLYRFEAPGGALEFPPSLLTAIGKSQTAVDNRSKKYLLPP